MQTVPPGLRIIIAVLAALAVMVAAPLHASHHHGDDPGQLDGPCAVCKSHSPACGSSVCTGAGSLLEPVGVLPSFAGVSPGCAPRNVISSRAPPASFA